MNKENIIEFFDGRAKSWDDEMIRDDRIINTILDNGNVIEGKEVLDVACGTGVLIPDYLGRKVKSVTAIDISKEMVKIAQAKFKEKNVRILCGDVEETKFDQLFDCVVVYNAFPHFPNPEKLVVSLAALLKKGGRLCIAHGMGKEQIDQHHKGAAQEVSLSLMEAEDLAGLMEQQLKVITVISNKDMYQVVAVKE